MATAILWLLLVSALCHASSFDRIRRAENCGCPENLFRCSCGACINTSFVCDGKVQCDGDSSDEHPALCDILLKRKSCTFPLKQPNLNVKVWGCESSDCQHGPGGNVPQGSVLSYSCDAGYKIVGRENVVCLENGWSDPPPKCETECGSFITKGETNLRNGKLVEVGEFPWHVGIYYTSSHQQICGGSLISRKLVLTAAHCLEKTKNPENYTIIVGKFHRDWNTVDAEEQRLSVKSIEVKEEYTGSENNYANDIGIIVLNIEVNITAFVTPVCLDSNKQYSNFQLAEGSFGSVAGWGINENNTASEKLQTAKLPFVGYRECIKSVAITFRPFFENDKFCAGYLNGTSVCRGDGGSGLVFEEDIGPKRLRFIQGVASVGQASEDGKYSCASQRTLFTKVVDHMPWILSVLNKYNS